MSVCPANIFVFYLMAIRTDIDLKFTQDTYGIVLYSLKKLLSYVKRQGHREDTVISQNLKNIKFSICFVGTSLYALSNETIKT